MRLHAASHLSPVADPFFTRLLDGLRAHADLDVHNLSRDMVPPFLALGTSVAELGWVCGQLHVHKQAEGGWPYEVLAAPVMAPQRYERQPVYFGDIVVPRAGNYESLTDALEGQFVMNEPESLSGYMMLVHRLRQENASNRLHDVVISGSHLASLRVVAASEIATTATRARLIPACSSTAACEASP